MVSEVVEKNLDESAAAPRFWEARVAAQLGIDRARLREFRRDHMAEGADFAKEGNAIVLTAAGIAKIRDVFGVVESGGGLSAESPALAKDGLMAGPPATLRVMIWKVPGNRQLLVCSPAAEVPGRRELLVRVRENDLFRVGMEFDAVEVGGVWQYTGRMPRKKGMW